MNKILMKTKILERLSHKTVNVCMKLSICFIIINVIKLISSAFPFNKIATNLFYLMLT